MLARLAYAAGAFTQAAAVALRPRNDLASPVPAQSQSAYEAGSYGRRSLGWFAPGSGPNAALLGGLATMRQRSRAAARNDPYAKGAIGKWTNNAVGTGIKPLSRVGDPVLRKAVQALWDRSTDEMDADGLLDFYGQQALAARSTLEGGECFARLRPRLKSDGLAVPLQVQLLEAELCSEYYTTISPTGNAVRAGVEFDQIGGRVAYWLWRAHPGDFVQQFAVQQERVRVPADLVVHMYDPLRPGQLRGAPLLAQTLVALKDINEGADAALVTYKLRNLFVGFRRLPAVPGPGSIDPLTGQIAQTDAAGRPLLPMEPGMWQDLYPGEELEWSKPPAADLNFADFMRFHLMGVSIGVETPYEILTGDLSKINDRTARIVLNEFRRGVQRFQMHVIAQQFCRPIWQAWWDRAVIAGSLPVDPVAYAERRHEFQAVTWTPQRWAYINPMQDVQARREEIRAGLGSRRDAVAELGEDVEQLDDEIAADNARADKLGLVFDTDPRKTQNNGASQGPVNPLPADAPMASLDRRLARIEAALGVAAA